MFGAIGRGLIGRGAANTCVAFAEAGLAGATGIGGGGGEGMSPPPKICVNSPASLGCEGGRSGIDGAIFIGPDCEGVMGDWK
jgi:hypothetical protein